VALPIGRDRRPAVPCLDDLLKQIVTEAGALVDIVARKQGHAHGTRMPLRPFAFATYAQVRIPASPQSA
jgi:hypothetical protein